MSSDRAATTFPDDLPIDPPMVDLPIDTHDRGFYDGFSREVTIPAKIIVTLIILWALFSAASETIFGASAEDVFGASAEQALAAANASIISQFSGWYVYLVAGLVVVSLALALTPKVGSLRMGAPGEKPEFSRFSWFAMLFGAGIGIGMLTFSTGEPLAHFVTNPDVIAGKVEAQSAENVRPAYLYTFLHWGFGAWCTYALVGLGIGYVAHRRGLPLTIRSALAPLFGRYMSGFFGHAVDVVAVVATILGVAYTMSLGVQQFVAGLFRLTGSEWLMDGDAASNSAVVIALIALVGASTLSALSGVGRGIKWLSNINMTLSFALLALFALVGSGFYALQLLGVGIWDYIVNLPRLSLSLFTRDGSEAGDALVDWQLGWSVSYWAWWIAFAPFVGMFIARISRGRTIREYILGVAMVPSLMCFIWMALAGGTAIDLELSGAADGAIVNAAMADQLYATLAIMLSPEVMVVVSALVVVLLMTYLVTSADSAILIINTINGAGEDEGSRKYHILFWGLALAFIVGSMLVVGGVEAIRITMIIGALPFSFVLVLMCVAIVKAVWFDIIRKRHGVPTTAQACEDWDGKVTPAE